MSTPTRPDRRIDRPPDPLFTEELGALGLRPELTHAIREAVRPWWLNIESFPYHALLASFLLNRHDGQPLIAALVGMIDRATVDMHIGFHLVDIVADVAVETQRPSDAELDAAQPFSPERERRKQVLLGAYLRQSGAVAMAQILERDPSMYYTLSDKGRRKLAKRSMA